MKMLFSTNVMVVLEIEPRIFDAYGMKAVFQKHYPIS